MNLERDNAFVKLIELQESSYLWLAQRLLHSKPINLCQGELEHGNSYLKTKRYYQAALIMSLLWLMSILVINGLKLYSLNKQTADIDAKIATIYHEFFPQAKQVISPKFRISQLLKSSQGKIELTFWTLVDKLSKYIKNSDITLEQLRFQNQTLTATIRAGNFVSLETLQSKLKQDLVQVKQTQASAKEKQIEATLELSL